MANLTAIILTKNEEKNIERCIKSVKGIAERIVVVDSYSNDRTVEIAESLGAEIYKNKFLDYANQFNWALDNVNVNTIWVYRIDADEVVTPELAMEIEEMTEKHTNTEITGFVMKFKIYFLGKFLKHGGVYPFYNLTIFKNGKGRYEARKMGEHIVLNQGQTLDLKHDCIHYDFKNLSSWIDKHNSYATRESEDYYDTINHLQVETELYHEAEKTKYLRDNFYYKLPKFLRARLYFMYRYYFKKGFLDGKEGYIYAYMQAYWYRFLVDAKIFEQEKTKNTKLLFDEVKDDK